MTIIYLHICITSNYGLKAIHTSLYKYLRFDLSNHFIHGCLCKVSWVDFTLIWFQTWFFFVIKGSSDYSLQSHHFMSVKVLKKWIFPWKLKCYKSRGNSPHSLVSCVTSSSTTATTSGFGIAANFSYKHKHILQFKLKSSLYAHVAIVWRIEDKNECT